MKVYGFPFSPFVRKVHIVAQEKGIAVEAAIGAPGAPSPEFLAASPFRKIPALEHGDYRLADSTAIVTYLDALVPEPAIFPTEAKARGKAIFYEEVADTIVTPAGGKIVFNRFVSPRFLGRPGDETAAAEGEAELAPKLDWFESVTPEEDWLTGKDYSIGDIAMASVFATLGYVGFAPDAAKHPRTAAWYARVTCRPAWRAVTERESAMLAARA